MVNNNNAIVFIIIWQAPRAGSMQRILCSDWIPERARWTYTARPGLPVSFPQIKFRHSSTECTKVFVRRNYFLFKVKRLYVLMDLEFVSVHKSAKGECGQYPAILTSRLVNNIYLSHSDTIKFSNRVCGSLHNGRVLWVSLPQLRYLQARKLSVTVHA